MNLINLPGYIGAAGAYILIGVVLLVLIFVFAVYRFGKKEVLGGKEAAKYRYEMKTAVMTPAEQRCYVALREAVGNKFLILAQVHLDAFLNEEITGQNWKGALSHIQRKSVDFLLCDPQTFAPVLAIELDDRSHDREDRIERDRVVNAELQYAGMPLLRITDIENLSGKISGMVAG